VVLRYVRPGSVLLTLTPAVSQHVRLEGTSVSIVDVDGNLQQGFQRSAATVRSADSFSKSATCDGFMLFSREITVSPSAHRGSYCTCNADHFRLSPQALCESCPAGCRCDGGYQLFACFPAATQLLRCPLLPDGTTACQGRVPWPYPSNMTAVADAGHYGRVCSQCLPAYFEDGRLCSPCLQPTLQWLSIVGFAVAFIVLLAYLYVDTDADNPTATQSMRVRILLALL
jgi:hypothetical protein